MNYNAAARAAADGFIRKLGFSAIHGFRVTFAFKLSIYIFRPIFSSLFGLKLPLGAFLFLINLGCCVLSLPESRGFAHALFGWIVGDGLTFESEGELLRSGSPILVYVVSSVACYNVDVILRWLWWHIRASSLLKPGIAFFAIICGAYVIIPRSWQWKAQIGLKASLTFVNFCLSLALGILLRCLFNGISFATWLWKHFLVLLRRREEELYKYRDLVGLQEIRLVKLSRTPGGRIWCELVHVSLEDNPIYHAISYTWDNSDLSHVVLVDGRWLQLTAKAHNILHDIASIWRTKYLWIDQICINQVDLDEKNVQVRLMTEIFRRATRVVAWLGNRADIENAIPLLEHLYTNLLTRRAVLEEQRRGVFSQTRDRRFLDLLNFLQLTFWSRVWIVQEIAVARKVHVVCCGRYMEWDTLSNVCSAFANPEHRYLVRDTEFERLGQYPAGINQVNTITRFRKRVQLGLSNPLLDIGFETSGFNATNPRDKIFALFGISSSIGDERLISDYNKSVEEVFLDAARHFLDQAEPVFLLHLAGVGYTRQFSLPSWVPDWSSLPRVATLRRLTHRALYTASSDRTAKISINQDSNALILEGILVDEVVKITDSFLQIPEDPGEFATSLYNENIYAHHEEARALSAEAPDPYLNGQSRSEAFWRTLIGDLNGLEHPAPASFASSYRARERVIAVSRRIFPPPLGMLAPEVQAFVTPGSLNLPLLFRKMGGLEAIEAICGSVLDFQADWVASTNFRLAQQGCSFGRRFAVTRKGYMAMVPPLTETGDSVCVFSGGQCPFILRRDREEKGKRSRSGGSYRFVGEAYVHGLMRGETLDHLAAGWVHLQEFQIR